MLKQIFRRLWGQNSERRKPKSKANVPLFPPAYLNRHSGATCLVLGNGPSLNEYRSRVFALIAKYDALVLGANHITDFIHPHYHAFTNRKRFLEYAHTIDSTKSMALLSPYFWEDTICSNYSGPYEYLIFKNNHMVAFDIQDGIIQANCRTVSVLLVAVAIVMGAQQIFVAGLDGFPHLDSAHEVDNAEFYFADTTVLKAERTRLLKTQQANARYLGEIQQFMLRHSMAPFSIVTPTVFDGHYSNIEELL